jgi:AraC-like DNA-binding protein
MTHSEIVINCGYGGLNPVQFGKETCEPNHAYGPAVRSHWLLHYIVSGCGTFTRNGVTQKVQQGEIFVIPPYLETYYKADAEKPWEYIWIGFTADEALTEVLAEPVITCPDAGKIFDDMKRCANYENGKSAYLAGCLWRLMAALKEKETKKTDYVDKALNCIHTEYAHALSVQEIADRLNLDRCYFSSLFSKQVGVAPGEYLRTLRLNKAAELMTVYDEKPSTAALSVGYEDLFHFSKSFKKQFGVSPREYVRQAKQNL